MGTWGVAEAKAKFSAVLDKVEAEGPQLVRRRKQEFYVLTKEQLATRGKKSGEGNTTFVSAWDTLRPSSGKLFDVEFPRDKSKARRVKF